MCGISGIVAKEKLSPELRAAVARMSAALEHRGPDGEGEFYSEQVALAARRLSIIDREGGWQPLYNEDKSLALVINGEIYNYIELRNALKAAGHEFRTATDGEVILHLYEENPRDFIRHLRGMFAFALYDARRRRIILARDRMGEKPLYLFESEGRILFASELKSLLASRLVAFELDARAVDLYFHYQYVPEPLTPVKGVRKLDAAKMLVIDMDDWRIEERAYWTMADAPPLDGAPEDLIRAKLEEVSALVVRSDVPVGVALSGGLDSSVVAAFAARAASDLHAFSVGYKGRPASDERADARALALFLDIPFTDVELETQQIVDFFPELNFWRDDPIADIAGFGYYAVMRLAREHGVPVILQGQGGDELFWGYPQMRLAAEENFKKAALLKNPLLQGFLQSLAFTRPQSLSVAGFSNWLRDFGGARSNRQKVKKRLATPDRLSFYDKSDDFLAAAAQVRAFYGSRFAAALEDENAYSPFKLAGDWETADIRLTELVSATYLRENGIAQGDRLGMASSVEMRLPLVDHQFVETVVGLRKSRTDADLPPKYRLKKAAEGILPEWVLNRPKRGFAPPTREWHAALFAAFGETLVGGSLVEAGVLKPESGRLLANGDFPAEAVCPLSFKALVLEQWCRQMRKITALRED